MQGQKHKSAAAATLLFAVLSLMLTYPLALHAADAVEDRQDALLNVWISAWDGRQLLENPLHLFDANIFYPYSRTLAYSDLLLGNGLLALPITASSGNPVLGYNVALFLSFVLSGLGTCLLVLALTRSPGAGVVAGTVFAFCSYRMSNLAQAQVLTTQWMPLALLALYQLNRSPRLRHVTTLVLFMCLQALSSFYYGLSLALAVLVLAVGFWAFDRRLPHVGRSSPVASRVQPFAYLLLAACCCLLILLPFAVPYFRVQRELGFERSLTESEPFSASLRQYLTVPAGSVLYGRWLPSEETPMSGGYPVDALFPGLAALALGFYGLLRGQGRARWFFVFLLLAFGALSLGPRLYLAPGQPAGLNITLPYAWLYAAVPGFKALRAPVRLNALAMLALSVLAGYGVAALGSRIRAASSMVKYSLPAVCCTLLVVLESLVWPAAHVEAVPVGGAVPPVYRWLAKQPPGPILELPMAFTAGGPQLEYQYLSTYHWRPTPDGYSGFIPPKHGQIVYEMERFPSERSVSLLQALRVEHVVIHTNRYPADGWGRMEGAMAQVSDLTLVERFGVDWVYQVQPRTFGLDGLKVRGWLPTRAAVGQPYTAYAIVVNRGGRSYAVRPTDLARPSAMWELDGETLTQGVSADIPLVTSPDGGAAVIPVRLSVPASPGTYHLTLGESGGPLGPWQVEGEVTVGDTGEMPDAQLPVPVQLAGWTVPSKVQLGQALPVKLSWRALGKVDAYYSIYVKLLNAAGDAVAGWDGQPRNGEAPTLLWVPGETVADSVFLTVPSDIPTGDYTVEVGMYRAEDLARALTLNAEGIPVDRVNLGVVRVEP